MKRKIFCLALVVFSLQWLSCGKGSEDVVTHTHNATIKVHVYQELAGGSNVIDVPIMNAYVELFKTKDDRDMSINQVKKQYTDSSGYTTFISLTEDYYYLTITHPTYGQKQDEVSTPDGTISYVDVIY